MLKTPHYNVIEKVWEGTSSVVYRAEAESDRSRVMLKLPRNEYPTAREVARIEREYTLLRQLDDKHIIKALGVERVQHGIALVTKDIEGTPLSALIASQSLDCGAKLKIAVALSEGLAALRRAHVLHKDIKPANIACNVASGTTQLIDFGLATTLNREVQHFVRPDALEGTLAYISPEQTGRMNRDIDHRSDLYSAGVTLYELFTGSLPFQAKDALEIVHSHIARLPDTPHERAPEVPEVISKIVMKLLSKEPESRYQTAEGLMVDLRRCAEQWEREGTITPFALGERDVSDVLRIPQKLYGREAEIAALLSLFEGARQGRAAMLLITGVPGVGKSALVQEFHRLIARHGGEFVSGKFDQLHRGLPFASFSQAFGGLVRQLLSEPPEKLEEWKQKLRAAVGANGRVVLDLLPELERIIGPQTPVSLLSPAESQTRFGVTFERLVRVFCTPGRPLVVFLDDLQWADSGSLWLLQYLRTSMKESPLLLIGAYRDQDVDEAHPLKSTLRDLSGAGLKPSEIHLDNIGEASTRALLADALPSASAEKLDALAYQLFRKTHGSPLFVTQLLLEWSKQGLLQLDPATGRWTWDQAAIADATVADNVAGLLADKLKTLPPSTQSLLSLASCIGYQFDRLTLATLANRSPAEVGEALWAALESGLAVPLDTNYRLAPTLDATPGAQGEPELQASFRFLHDRVQNAAYSLIKPEEKQDVHLRIGRQLRAKLPATKDAEMLFEVVNHLNRGASSVTSPAERIDLAQLNLAAGESAKNATSFGPAVAFLEAGLTMLDETSWESHYDLSFKLHYERAECLYMSREAERAERAFEELLTRARTKSERASLYRVSAMMYMTIGRIADALGAGQKGLALYGIELPSTMEGIIGGFQTELAAIDGWLKERPLESLLEAPMLSGDNVEVAALLSMSLPAAFWVNPALIAVISSKLVSIMLTHGVSKHCLYGLAVFGVTLNGFTGRVADAIAFSEIALKLGERLGARGEQGLVYNVYGAFAASGRPYRIAADGAKRSIPLLIDSGNLLIASNSTYHQASTVYQTGEPLDRIMEELEHGLTLLRWTKDVTTPGALLFMRQMVACLQGKTKGHASMDDDTFAEADRLAYEESIKNVQILAVHGLCKLELASWYGEPETYLDGAMRCEQIAATFVGVYYGAEVLYYGALVLLARYSSAQPEEQARILEVLERLDGRIAAAAKGCPENYEHRRLLFSAEMARIKGDFASAQDLYDAAISLAQENGFVQHEAMANELCAKMYLALKRQRIARAYMSDARSAYRRWGAHGKVRQLEEKFSDILPRAPSRDGRSALLDSTQRASISTTTSDGLSLDVPTIVKASQALSSEISFDKLILQLMSVVAENAGAEKGSLILPKDGELRVVADVAAQGGVIMHQEPIALGLHESLSSGIVHYVNRTHESVILDNAAVEGPFKKDPHVMSRKPKSVLCIPLLNQGRMMGILYLENSLVAGSFTVDRTTLLGAVCSQMAISIENAYVYANLEALVQERTRELREAQALLLRLERQATEVQMAGGFAHEMRNALTGAQLRLHVVYDKNSSSTSIGEGAAALKDLFLISKEHLPPPEFDRTVKLFQTLNAVQKKVNASLSAISVDIHRALGVTTTLLDYSRQGAETPGTLPVDMQQIVENVARSVAGAAPEGAISVDLAVDPEFVVPGNESHFFSILNNLFLNACSAVMDVTDDRDRKVQIKVAKSADQVLMEVTDNGTGIAPNHLSRIFEPFFSTKPNMGTGLGLCVVDKLVHLYKGKIDVKSEPQQGTTFSVRIPILSP